MSQQNTYIAAIDIGTSKIVAIIGKKNPEGRVEIAGLGNVAAKGVKRGVVLNIEETSNSIRKAMDTAQDQAGVEVENVLVGISGQHIKSIKNRGYKYIDNDDQEVTQADVDQLTNEMYKLPMDEGMEIIHVIPQSYVVDSETDIQQPVGMFAKRLDGNFHVIIGHIGSAKNIVKCVQRAGFEVQRLIFEPLASSDAILTEEEKEAGVALIDIGGGTTDIAVYYDNILRHTAVIPYGGFIVTKDIREGCSILQKHAEQLKLQFGSALADLTPENKVVTIPSVIGTDSKEISFKSLAYIIQARMSEILAAINFEIENSGYAYNLNAGAVLTGGGALLKNLTHLVNYELSYDARVGVPKASFIGDGDIKIELPGFSTSVGLLRKGLFELPDDEISENKERLYQTKERIKTKGGRLVKSIKNALSDLFDEQDADM